MNTVESASIPPAPPVQAERMEVAIELPPALAHRRAQLVRAIMNGALIAAWQLHEIAPGLVVTVRDPETGLTLSSQSHDWD